MEYTKSLFDFIIVFNNQIKVKNWTTNTYFYK